MVCLVPRPQVRLSELLVGMTCEVDAVEQGRGDGKAVLVAGAFCNNGLMRFYGDFAVNICNWLARREVCSTSRARATRSRTSTSSRNRSSASGGSWSSGRPARP